MNKRRTFAFGAVVVSVLLGAVTLGAPQTSHAQPRVPVEVVNPATNPVRTREVENPARLRFQSGGGFIDFADGDFQVIVDHPPLPAGKVFVIEFLTAYAQLPSGQKVRVTLFVNDGLTIAQHLFAPTLVGTDVSVDVFVMSQPVRLYAVSSAQTPPISVTATRFGGSGNQGTGFVRLSFSGYLVDQ